MVQNSLITDMALPALDILAIELQSRHVEGEMLDWVAYWLAIHAARSPSSE
jgi:hypothetical protein